MKKVFRTLCEAVEYAALHNLPWVTMEDPNGKIRLVMKNGGLKNVD